MYPFVVVRSKRKMKKKKGGVETSSYKKKIKAQIEPSSKDWNGSIRTTENKSQLSTFY